MGDVDPVICNGDLSVPILDVVGIRWCKFCWFAFVLLVSENNLQKWDWLVELSLLSSAVAFFFLFCI